MTTFMLHFVTAWNDHFPEANPNPQMYTSRQTLSGTNAYVSNCLFESITSSSHGGAIYSSSATFFLVESSSFFSCKTSSQNGGALFFQNLNGQSVLYELCGFDCFSTHSTPIDQFGNILVKNNASCKNRVNCSSITRCVSENSNSCHTIRHGHGKIFYTSVNISLNKCYYRSIYCYPFHDTNSVTCSFLYSSFTDNAATGYTFLMLFGTGTKYEIKSCNILRNTQTDYPTTEGTIYSSGSTMISDSCILENNATYVFRQGSTYKITLSNCTVDKTTNNGYLTIQNTVTKSFILALNHMSTQNCHSEYDSAGYLTPITQLSKQNHCYTGGKVFYRLILTDIFSLTSVFIFNFIYPDTSSYKFF
jgi:hypothetical protein